MVNLRVDDWETDSGTEDGIALHRTLVGTAARGERHVWSSQRLLPRAGKRAFQFGASITL